MEITMKHYSRIVATLLLGSSFAMGANLYAGAEMYTQDVFHYGRFEARMQMAVGSGVVSSMFLYYPNSSVKGNPWREIDIEVLGNNSNGFQSNLITGTSAVQIQSAIKEPLSFDVSQAYHTYGIDWTPDSIVWYVDGTQIRKTTGQQVIDLRDSSETFRFNLWSSTSVGWVGAWNDAILPVHQFINWARYSSYTPGAGPNGSNFTLQWTDNFDAIDNTRWSFGNWTFNQNRVDFTADNAVLQDGNMILNLTKDPITGFTGTVPADNGTVAIKPASNQSLLLNPKQNRIIFSENRLFVQTADGKKLLVSGRKD